MANRLAFVDSSAPSHPQPIEPNDCYAIQMKFISSFYKVAQLVIFLNGGTVLLSENTMSSNEVRLVMMCIYVNVGMCECNNVDTLLSENWSPMHWAVA